MDLLERFAAGDVDAFEALFTQHQREVYCWIVRVVRNPAVAEELTVDTFWRAYRKRRGFDPSRPFGPWARRIATHIAIDYLRTAPRIAQPPPPEPAVLPASDETRTAIHQAFLQLPARLRAAATLALIEERPYEEIAEALGTSVSAVKMRVWRAVRRLRTCLEQMGVRP
jgi:RNA polymerase sigma-70 factor (ECF subfamily)